MFAVSQARLQRTLAVCCCLASLACSHTELTPAADGDKRSRSSPELQALPSTALVMDGARPALCEHPGKDLVRETFCGETAPTIQSLRDLQRALKLKVVPDQAGLQPRQSGHYDEEPEYATEVLLSHSTALSGTLVSPLNPRLIIMTYNTFFAFNRGVQQVELAVRDREAQRMNFYLISFRQACNLDIHGCKPGDLFTPSIESDWRQVAVQDDEELKNTPSDCRQCHQRGTAQPTLLMRELDGPWTHFFSVEPNPKSTFPEPFGSDLVQDYLAAKGDEPYGDVPVPVMQTTIGFSLQNLVPADQPLIFDGSVIMNERWPWSPDGYAPQPVRSETWDLSYAAFKLGKILALPFYAARATDPRKQAQLTAAYVSYRAGSLPAEELPDLAEIFPDDPLTRAEIGLQTEPGAAPPELLIQACAMCHNDVLDQSISRARFTVALGRLAPSELALAVDRLQLERGAPGAMPPSGRRQLAEDARARLIAYLQARTRANADDELLERVAQLGMAQKQQKSQAELDLR